MNFTSSLSAKLGANLRFTLALFGYLALTLVNGSILLHKRHKLNIPWYWYALLAFFDVQGNYLVNSAYYFTSITSVELLDCWTLAWVVLLTWYFLGTKYSLLQFIGAAMCCVGLGLVFLSDARIGNGGGSNPLLGDILVIGSTVFSALCNVGEEYCAKNTSITEILAMFGLFGVIFSVIEIGLFERKDLEAVTWSAKLILTFAGNMVGFCTFYSLTPVVLQKSGATLLNLSLLTADMWAVVIRIFFYHQRVDWLYYVSFAIVVVGLFIYSKSDKNPDPVQEQYIDPVQEQGIERPRDATP